MTNGVTISQEIEPHPSCNLLSEKIADLFRQSLPAGWTAGFVVFIPATARQLFFYAPGAEGAKQERNELHDIPGTGPESAYSEGPD